MDHPLSIVDLICAHEPHNPGERKNCFIVPTNEIVTIRDSTTIQLAHGSVHTVVLGSGSQFCLRMHFVLKNQKYYFFFSQNYFLICPLAKKIVPLARYPTWWVLGNVLGPGDVSVQGFPRCRSPFDHLFNIMQPLVLLPQWNKLPSVSLAVLFVFATMFVTVKVAGLWLLTLPGLLFLVAIAGLLPSIRDRGGSGSSKRAVLTDAHLRSVWTNNRWITCQSSGGGSRGKGEAM